MLYFYSIGNWVFGVLFIIALIATLITATQWDPFTERDIQIKKKVIRAGGVITVIALILGVWCAIGYYTSTTQGKASIKSYTATVTGQKREITIYSATGEQIDKFEATANVDYTDGRVEIQKKDGKRVIVYGTTAIVVVTQP